jgi:hypothetical protein
MRRTRLIPLLLSLLPVSPLLAQWQLSGEAGASRVHQPGVGVADAVTLGATLDVAGERAALRAATLGARTSDDRWTGQALGVGLYSTPSWHSWALQGIVSLSAFGQTTLGATTSGDFAAQLRYGTGARGVALGGAAATTVHNAETIASRRALLDAWWVFGSERFTLNAVRTQTPAVFGESSIIVDFSTVERTYSDLASGWRHDADAWSVGVDVGWRHRDGLEVSDRWSAGEASAWLTPHVAVVASAGKSLEDLVRGVPRASYLTLGLRILAQPHLHLRLGRDVVRGPRLIAERDRDGAAIVRVSAPKANVVEMMGDFTDWSPVTLERGGETWTYRGSIARGLHRVAIRIDGGEWIVPLNLPRADDDFGGTVGLITVP